VKPDRVDAFKEATIANARGSVFEPGCARFDLVQDAEDPTRFVLLESYRPGGAAAHKETVHYQRWRDAVAEMMVAPRSSRRYVNLFPEYGGS